MNQTTVAILAIILAVLLVAYMLVPSSRPDVLDGTNLRTGTKILESFDPAQAKAIEFKKGDQTVRLEKVDKNWKAVKPGKDVATGRKVDGDRVEALLSSLKGAGLSEARTGELKRFDLDEANRLSIVVNGEGGKELGSLYIGKNSDVDKCFVLKPKDKEAILEININLTDSVGVRTVKDVRTIAEDFWYDLRVTKFNQEDVTDIAITRGTDTIKLKKVTPPKPEEKKDEAKPDEKKEEPRPEWQFVEPLKGVVEQSNANTIASTAAFLFATGYADDIKPEEIGLDKPTAITTVTLKDGTKYTYKFGKIGEDFALVQVEGAPEIWKVAKYNFQGLAKELKELKKEDLKVEGEKKPATPKPFSAINEPGIQITPANGDKTAIPPPPDKVKEEPKTKTDQVTTPK